MEHSELLGEITRHLEKTNTYLRNIKCAETGAALRDNWEEFLLSFCRTFERIIECGSRFEHTKPFAHQQRNSFQKDDVGLVFIREARNIAAHALTPFAYVQDRGISVGRLAFLSGGGSFSMENCTINGVPVDNFHIHEKDGKVDTLLGTAPLPITEEPAMIHLVEIVSKKKNRTFPIPDTIFGRILVNNDPTTLAINAYEGLVSLLNDFTILLMKK